MTQSNRLGTATELLLEVSKISLHRPRRPRCDPVSLVLVTTLHYTAGASLLDKGVAR